LYVKNDSGATSIKYQEENCAAGILFNAVTGAITGTFGTVISSSVENVGNGWYRIQFAYTSTNTTNVFIIYSTLGTANTFVLWGAQLNIGSTAKPYFPTTDRLNVPRLTYQNGGGGCPSLLLEKQSTNSLAYSEQFDNAYWTSLQLTVAANQTTSPDGTQNAEKFTEDAVSGVHLFYNNSSVTSASTSTASIFYKKGTRRYFAIKLQIGSNSYTQVFDADGLTTGSNSSNGLTSVSTSIVSMGNGWVRASVTGTDPLASTACYMICSLSNSATPTFDSGNFNPSYLGSSSEYGFFWGAQFEASSYKTSYIPTTSASATRVADACSKTGISSLIGQTEGVIFVDFNFIPHASQVIIAIEDWVTNLKVINIGSPSNTEITAQVFDGGNSFVSNFASAVIGQRYKCALAYKTNNFAFYVNGTQVSTGTTGSVPACLNFQLGKFDPSQVCDNSYKQAALFKTRLTNAELASLTTI
jgi:hypothetical protein